MINNPIYKIFLNFLIILLQGSKRRHRYKTSSMCKSNSQSFFTLFRPHLIKYFLLFCKGTLLRLFNNFECMFKAGESFIFEIRILWTTLYLSLLLWIKNSFIKNDKKFWRKVCICKRVQSPIKHLRWSFFQK